MPPKNRNVSKKRGQKRPLPVNDDDSSTSLSTVPWPGVSWDSLKERTNLLVERIKLLGTDFEEGSEFSRVIGHAESLAEEAKKCWGTELVPYDESLSLAYAYAKSYYEKVFHIFVPADADFHYKGHGGKEYDDEGVGYADGERGYLPVQALEDRTKLFHMMELTDEQAREIGGFKRPGGRYVNLGGGIFTTERKDAELQKVAIGWIKAGCDKEYFDKCELVADVVEVFWPKRTQCCYAGPGMEKEVSEFHEKRILLAAKYLEDICQTNSEGENRLPFDVACEKIREDLRGFKEMHDELFLKHVTKSRAWVEGWVKGARRLREQAGTHVATMYAGATLGNEPDFGEEFPKCYCLDLKDTGDCAMVRKALLGDHANDEDDKGHASGEDDDNDGFRDDGMNANIEDDQDKVLGDDDTDGFGDDGNNKDESEEVEYVGDVIKQERKELDPDIRIARFEQTQFELAQSVLLSPQSTPDQRIEAMRQFNLATSNTIELRKLK